MLGYQNQNSPATLAQGVAEYFDAHPGLTRGPGLSGTAQAFFRCHDVAHVVLPRPVWAFCGATGCTSH